MVRQILQLVRRKLTWYQRGREKNELKVTKRLLVIPVLIRTPAEQLTNVVITVT